MSVDAVPEAAPLTKLTELSCIDCDIHVNFADAWADELSPYLSPEWREILGGPAGYVANYQLPVNPFYPVLGGALRLDLEPEGVIPGADPAVAAKQLLDAHKIDRAVIQPQAALTLSIMPNPDVATAIAGAINDWSIEKWLQADPRWRGLITLVSRDIEWSVREIERLAGTPGIVGIFFSLGPVMWGDKYWFPIYEAAQHHDLQLVTHVSVPGIFTAGPDLPGGIHTHYLDYRASINYPHISNLANMISNGVFELYPKLKIMFTELGFAWLPDLMWRMDQTWKSMRRATPWVKRPPSEYIVNHFKTSSQPWLETRRRQELIQILEMISAEQTLVYSSDYPHWDFDDPSRMIREVPEAMRQRLLVDNALDFFGDRML
jgi:predicted TIM-barrel fold metal-dependent hydrolase